jgi:hypothetical protein
MSSIEVRAPGMPVNQGNTTGFQKGHPRYGGRRRGSKNRFGGDLREEIVAAIQETGFIQKNAKGKLVGTGKDGCKRKRRPPDRFAGAGHQGCPPGKRGKSRGGMIIRFTGGRESDSLRACRRPTILTACRTPS